MPKTLSVALVAIAAVLYVEPFPFHHVLPELWIVRCAADRRKPDHHADQQLTHDATASDPR